MKKDTWDLAKIPISVTQVRTLCHENGGVRGKPKSLMHPADYPYMSSLVIDCDTGVWVPEGALCMSDG